MYEAMSYCFVQDNIIMMHCVEWYMKFLALHISLILDVKVLHYMMHHVCSYIALPISTLTNYLFTV